jgi:2-keto-4-pentenoate hydratase/2-oxohepta-3-ene-1,7-dioic acid hydratase in catechol pathway
MKLASYRTGDEVRVGAVQDGGRIFDLRAARARDGDAAHFASMLALVDAGEAALDDARRLLERFGADPALSRPLAEVRLEAPLRPRQMRDCMSYELHIRQGMRGNARVLAAGDPEKLAALDRTPLPPLADIYRKMPIYYITSSLVVQGPDAVIRWPRYSRVMDYELEWGIVVGRDGADIREGNARDHIFGYTVFNDFSARDQQAVEMQGMLGPAKGKCFDGSNVLGPWIVTKDEMGDPYAQTASVRVNGEVRGAGTTADMLFNFEQILAYISRDETVRAGEFIGSGTIGNGCGVETGIFLEDGDVVELEIERIGVLRNKVVRQRA